MYEMQGVTLEGIEVTCASCPLQIEGTINDRKFCFKARRDVSLEIAALGGEISWEADLSPEADTLYPGMDRYYGHMTVDEAIPLLKMGLEWWLDIMVLNPAVGGLKVEIGTLKEAEKIAALEAELELHKRVLDYVFELL